MRIHPDDIASASISALERRLAREFPELSALVERVPSSTWRGFMRGYEFEQRELIVDEQGKRVVQRRVPVSEEDLLAPEGRYGRLVHPAVQQAHPGKQYQRLFVGPRQFLSALKDLGLRGYQQQCVLRIGDGPFKPLEELTIGLNYRDAGVGVALLRAAGAGEVVLVDQQPEGLMTLLHALGVPPPSVQSRIDEVGPASLAGLIVQFDPSRRVKKEYRRALLPAARYGRLDMLA